MLSVMEIGGDVDVVCMLMGINEGEVMEVLI